MTASELSIENKYISTEPTRMTLRVPYGECHPMFGPKIVQAKLKEEWVLDGEFMIDYQTNEIVIKLRKL